MTIWQFVDIDENIVIASPLHKVVKNWNTQMNSAHSVSEQPRNRSKFLHRFGFSFPISFVRVFMVFVFLSFAFLWLSACVSVLFTHGYFLLLMLWFYWLPYTCALCVCVCCSCLALSSSLSLPFCFRYQWIPSKRNTLRTTLYGFFVLRCDSGFNRIRNELAASDCLPKQKHDGCKDRCSHFVSGGWSNNDRIRMHSN